MFYFLINDVHVQKSKRGTYNRRVSMNDIVINLKEYKNILINFTLSLKQVGIVKKRMFLYNCEAIMFFKMQLSLIILSNKINKQ